MAERPGVFVLGDLGSTFTKLVAVDATGAVVCRVEAPTVREELNRGFDSAFEELVSRLGRSGLDGRVLLSSSAAGGLRLAIVGLEPQLTVRFGRMAASTAGGRIVGAFGLEEFNALDEAAYRAVDPDIVILTGGTDGGDSGALPRAARQLNRLGNQAPVVVAGNQSAYDATRGLLGDSVVTRYVENVMPRIGSLVLEPVRRAIREMFIEHVIGRGRFASASDLARWIAMPTPDAVLSAAEELSRLGDVIPGASNPIIVDVGGATTDVHSVLAQSRLPRRGGVDGPGPRRTVEADLGMRESSSSLLLAAHEAYWLERPSTALREGVVVRTASRSFVPADGVQRGVDRTLALLATGMSVARHAGEMRVQPGARGLEVTLTGRDLRRAGLVIATGGVFAHMAAPDRLIGASLALAERKGALVPPVGVRVIVDRQYVLWAAGLLAKVDPTAARALLQRQFGNAARGMP